MSSKKAIEKRIQELMIQQGWTLATAESCTGGLIGHLLTNVPGSSAYYSGGVITYSNEIKTRILQVPKGVLDQDGAVSEKTVLSMLRGVSSLFQSDCALAVSGIAGPEGGSKEKPAGLVYMGVKVLQEIRSVRYEFSGTREEIKHLSALGVLELFLETCLFSLQKALKENKH